MDVENLPTLFSRCAAGLDSACEDMYRTLRPLFQRIAGRIARQFRASAETEDLVQEICMRIAEKKNFLVASLPREEDQARRYFAVLAANVARDWFRKRLAQSRNSDLNVSLDDRIPELAAALDIQRNYDHNHLMQQIESSVPGDRRQQAIFRLY